MKQSARSPKNVTSVNKMLEEKALSKTWREAAGLLSRSAKKNIAELRQNSSGWDTRLKEQKK